MQLSFGTCTGLDTCVSELGNLLLETCVLHFFLSVKFYSW